MIKYQVEYEVVYSKNLSDLLVISATITCLESDLSVGTEIFVGSSVSLRPIVENRGPGTNFLSRNFDTLEEAQDWTAAIRANIEEQHSVFGKMTEAGPPTSGAVRVYVVE